MSASLTGLITSAISSAMSALTSGTTFEARNRPSGSSSVTSFSVWMRGSALNTFAMFTVPATRSWTVVSPVATNDTSTP
ncbi:Uncharacterised protein [Mycobacteroides abscessus]|nr:Uncharacterised protein [Mycobacteroides abscessus]